MVRDFHHFKGNELTRSEQIQRAVVELLLNTNSITWELKHSSGCCQIGRILAQKRKLDVEIAEIACILHDICVIVEGKYEEHARRGAETAKRMLEESGDFNGDEIQLITEAIAHHSEKQIRTGKPYIELVKDADVFDCSLYENAQGFYVLHKPKDVYDEYVKRIKIVRKELGLGQNEVFREGK
ncbi:HD domain-containing protein [Candidatus Woesearchaeota archaeon]|nr:HD domain-containing protein [Candidatus Woesearchaeota archaeon]